MSQLSPISKYVHTRFREVFGEPHRSMGKDDHWSLPPTPMKAPIYVLVNGTIEQPAVWVFDTHDVVESVAVTSITNQDLAEGVIKQIQERVKRAGQPREPDKVEPTNHPSVEDKA